MSDSDNERQELSKSVQHSELKQSETEFDYDESGAPIPHHRCHDWPFAIVFLALTGAVVVLGMQGLVQLKNLSICNKFGDAPSSGGPVQAFDRCLVYFFDSPALAPGLCTQYAVTRLSVNPSSWLRPRTHVRELTTAAAADTMPGQSPGAGTAPTPIRTSALPTQAQDAYTECFSKISNPMSPTSAARTSCAQYAAGIALSGSAASRLRNECMDQAISGGAGSVIRSCSRYAVSASDTSTQSEFDSCWPSSQNKPNDPATVLSCLKNKLQPILGSSTYNNLESKCLSGAVNGNTAAPASCAEVGTASVLPSNKAYFAASCAAPFVGGAPGAPASCLKATLESQLSVSEVTTIYQDGLNSGLGTSSLPGGDCLVGLFGDPSGSVSCLISGVGSFPSLARLICDAAVSQSGFDVQSVYSGLENTIIHYKNDIVVTLSCVLGLSVALAVHWLIIMYRHAETLIRQAVAAIIFNLLFMAAFNFAIGNIPGAVFILLTLIFKLLWFCWVWKDIKFASVVLRTALEALKDNPGPFLVGAVTFLLMGVWCVLWAGAYFRVRDAPGVGITVLVLSFFWTTEVLKNVLACTVIGTVSTWYFKSGTEHMPKAPTMGALVRSVTLAFGSICFGSLLVAILKTFQYLLKKSKETDRKWLKLCLMFMLKCFENILQMFNMYAFVQTMTYGKSYLRSARDTWELVKEAGIEAITNDTLIDGVLSTGRLTGALSTAGLAGVLARWHFDMPWDLTFLIMFIGLLFGYVMLSLATVVVEVAAAALFVNFAQHPHGLRKGQPYLYKNLIDAWRARHKRLPDFLNDDNDEMEKGDTSKEAAPTSWGELWALHDGPYLVKHGHGVFGRKKRRLMRLDKSDYTLSYKEGEDGKLDLARAKSVSAANDEDNVRFNLVMACDSDKKLSESETKTYQFTAPSTEVRDIWVEGLEREIAEAKENAKKCCVIL